MKLLTKDIEKKAKSQYEKGSDLDQMVVAKFFNPSGLGTWYLMNIGEDGDYCWGIVDLFEIEMGSFSLNDLKEIKLPFGLKIERDLYFAPIKAKDLWDGLNNGKHY